MKVLLINPPPKKIIEQGDATVRPNLGLAYLGAVLRESKFNPIAIDARFEQITQGTVLKRAENEKPDIIGITAMTHMVNDAHDLAIALKKMFLDVKIIIGGPHATALPQQTLEEFNSFDILVYGEGESALIDIVKCLESNNDAGLEQIPGIGFRKGTSIIITPPRVFIQNLDELPFPAWDLFPVSTSYPIMIQRGCPGRCNFCMRVLGDKVRQRSPENVIKEMKYIVERFNVTRFGFEENFGLNQKRTEILLDLILRELPPITWEAAIRVTSINEKMIKKMVQAGCYYVGFGVETGDEEILKKSKKGIDLNKAIKATRLAKLYGVRTMSFFIIGHPDETDTSIDKTIDFLVKMNTDDVSIGIMVPYPGTEIYKMALAGEGGYRMISNSWDDFNKQIGNALELKDITRQTLERKQLQGYLKFYLYNFRFLDLFKMVVEHRRLLAALIDKLLFKKNKPSQ